MIAKVPARRNDGRSSFASLSNYLTAAKLDRETGEVLRDLRDVHIESNCLSVQTAPVEMRAVADMNARANDPVYHCVISWQAGERPTDKQMVDAAKAAQAAIGMDGHQYLYAIHKDTDNVHIHMMINRVHPDTHKAVYPKRDYFALDKCMREIEISQGWKHDNGPYRVSDGKVIRSERKATPSTPTKVRDLEAATGGQSLLSYAQEAAPEIVKTLESWKWQELHSALRQHGLAIREAGQGFKIFDIANPETPPIKASDVAPELGGGKLKKRLGEFEKPLRVVSAEKSAKTYNPYREAKRSERDERREARAAARLELRQRFETEKRERSAKVLELRAAERQALRDLSQYSRTERERVRALRLGPESTKTRMSLIAMEAAAKREKIKESSVQKRAATRGNSYRDWCSQEATAGDEAAIAQLKSWEYQETRRRRAAEKAEEEAARTGSIRADEDAKKMEKQRAQPAPPAGPLLILQNVEWTVDHCTGDVTYRLRGADALRDTGRQVSVLQPTDDESVEAALRLGAQKFGAKLTLTGPQGFQRRCVEIAVKKGLGLKFSDPTTETYRLQLERQRGSNSKEKSGEHSKAKTGSDRAQDRFNTRNQASPANEKDR